MLEPEEQSAIVGATFAAIHAISAKSARPRERASRQPRARRPLRFLGLLLRTLSFSGPDRLSPFPAVAGVEREIYDEADAG